jgi:cell division protein FtsX
MCGGLRFFPYLCTQKRAKLLTQLAGRNVQTTTIMASVTSIPKPAQMIITLEDNALVADIKRALKMIRGVASVRVAKVDDDKTITPAMRQSINKARREYAKGETITCRTPEEMQKYFDSL